VEKVNAITRLVVPEGMHVNFATQQRIRTLLGQAGAEGKMSQERVSTLIPWGAVPRGGRGGPVRGTCVNPKEKVNFK